MKKCNLFRWALFVGLSVLPVTILVNLTAINLYALDDGKSGTDGSSTREFTPESTIFSLPVSQNEKLNLTLRNLMDIFKVPGMSIAVIDDYKIAWARGFGVTEPGGSTPVTPRTLFQAGSISKPVAAAGALWLVEHGKLFLDEDVNKKLKTWKVPDNEFTKTEKVTLRRLMSHSAGLTVHGFPGYAVGESIPTLVQVFNGEKPANTDPVRVEFVPGTAMRYSGGGVTIEQQLMIDVTGKPFPQFMRETVLSKIGMADSTYEQPIPSIHAPLTATGTRMDGVPISGKWHIYPEMAAAGLWTTPVDLAKFAVEIALSKHNKANHVLSEKMTREMLASQVKGESVGLGFFLGDQEDPDQFGHNGADEGFQALLMMFADSGKGIALMGNSDAFLQMAPYVMNAVARQYAWKNPPAPRSAGDILVLIQKIKGTQAAIEQYERLKQGMIEGYKTDDNALNQLGYNLLSEKKTDDAIRVFQLNVKEYPQHWNCYDSLGDAYMNAGQREFAIESYAKSVELNPQNQNGVEALKKLRGEK